MENYRNVLKQHVESLGGNFIPLEEEASLIPIYELFLNDKPFVISNSLEALYYGFYHQTKGSIEEMKQCYLWAIEQGNSDAMVDFANYHEKYGSEEEMLKYYLMAIEHGNSYAMYHLACYYHNKTSKKKKIEKYYLMAIEHGNFRAMNNLAYYYEEIGKKEEMLKYYLMAIEHGSVTAMNNLACYYEEIGKKEEMLKYYSMAIEHGNVDAMYHLARYYKRKGKYELMVFFYRMAIEKGNHVNALQELYQFWFSRGKYETCLELYEKHKDQKIWNKTELFHCIWALFKQKEIQNMDRFLEIVKNFDFSEITDLPVVVRMFQKLLKYDLDLIQLHFQYMPGAEGALAAQKDFIHYMTSSPD